MAVLNISMPIRREELMSVLEAQTCPKYTFRKWINHIEAQYEVEDDGTHGDLVQYTKKLFRKTKFGKVIMFRVLYNGQFFEGGVIREDLKK